MSYSVVQNDSLNIIVGRPSNGVLENFPNWGVDLKYHSPYLNIYVRSSQFAVGGPIDPPTENVRLQLANVTAPGNTGQKIELSDINLRIGLRFQIGASVYCIEQLVTDNSILARCVYGTRKGSDMLFDSSAVTRAVFDKL